MTDTVSRQMADRAVTSGANAYTRNSFATSDGERLEVPTEMQGKVCEFTCRGTAFVAIRFGDSSVAVDESTVSSVTSEALTAGGKEPHLMVFQDGTEAFRIPSGVTHMAHISGDTNGKFHFGVKTGEGAG